MVLLASMFIMTFVYGMLFVFGSFFTAMLDKYNENRSTTATVQALFIGVGLTSGVFSGMLIARFGIRKVSLTGAVLVPTGFIVTRVAGSIILPNIAIGVIAGFGVSLLQVSSLTAASRSFTGRQRSLVIAIQNACMGLGGIVLPFINAALLKRYDLGETFFILGGLYLNCIPAALILSTNSRHIGIQNVNVFSNSINEPRDITSRQTPSLIEMLKQLYLDFKEVVNIPYVLVIVAGGITISTLDGYMTLIFDIFKWKGFTSSDAVIALTISNVAGFIARIIPGFLKQLPVISSYVAPMCFTVFGVIGQLTMYCATTLTTNYVGCCVVGLAAGGLSASGYVIVAKYSEDDKLSLSLGLALSAIGVSTVVTGPLFGAIYDSYGSYAKVHFIIIAIQMMGAVLYLMSFFQRRRCRIQKTSSDITVTVYVVNDR